MAIKEELLNHVMIDLETLDTKPSAIILSIGACEFNFHGDIGRTFYCTVDMNQEDRTCSADTLKWWLQQDAVARDEAFGGTTQLSVALQRLNSFMHPNFWQSAKRDYNLWANSPSFDCVILRDAYDKLKLECGLPSYGRERDVRTLKNLFKNISVEEVGTAHNALDDAIYQAKLVAACMTEKAAQSKLAGAMRQE
jgi:hypothetical protein